MNRHIITPITHALVFTFDGGGAAITAPQTLDLYVPFACRIIDSVVLADQSGSCTLDVRMDSYTNYPPTGGDSIVASSAPELSSATKSRTALTGWTTYIPADSTVQVYASSVTTCTRLIYTLTVQRL